MSTAEMIRLRLDPKTGKCMGCKGRGTVVGSVSGPVWYAPCPSCQERKRRQAA